MWKHLTDGLACPKKAPPLAPAATPTGFAGNKRGTVLILTTLVLPLLILAAGGAVDFALVTYQAQKLKNAADNAALSGVNEAYIAFTRKEDVDLRKLVEESAEGAFMAEIERSGLTDNVQVSVAARIDRNAFSVDVSYRAQIKTSFLQIARIAKFNISNVSSASASVAIYSNVNLVFDVSASMGIGATPAQQEIVAAATGCAFSCHVGGNKSYLNARAAGAVMRIDVARNAAIQALNVVEKGRLSSDHVTFSVHTFDNTLETFVTPDGERAADIPYVRRSIEDNVHMRTYGGGTNIQKAISDLVESLPTNGSGRTPDDRVQYIVVFTDGVESTQALYPGKGWIQHGDAELNEPYKRHANHEVNYAMDPTFCTDLRDNHMELFFIYTEYARPVFGSFRGHDVNRFNFIEDTLFDIIPDRFRECAGAENHVFLASSPTEIDNAFSAIFADVVSPIRLQR